MRRGGKCIMDETKAILAEKIMIPTGTVEVTGAGRLKSSYVIHAVGPNLNDPS